jgi:hypothetical protein
MACIKTAVSALVLEHAATRTSVITTLFRFSVQLFVTVIPNVANAHELTVCVSFPQISKSKSLTFASVLIISISGVGVCKSTPDVSESFAGFHDKIHTAFTVIVFTYGAGVLESQ